MADDLKAKGNAAFQAGKFEEAVEHFTAAIAVENSNHVFYSNRSAAYASLNKFDLALQDADKTIELKADWAKGYGRKGAALFGMGDFFAARDAYTAGLAFETTNQMLLDGVAACDREIRASTANAGNGMGQIAALFCAPDALQKLAANPKTSAFLADPSFRATLERIRANPNAIGSSFDQRLLMCMTVLLGDRFPGDATDGSMATGADDEGEDVDVDVQADTGEAATPQSDASKPSPAPVQAETAAEPEAEDDEAAKARREAQEEKSKGTEAYKAKNFDVALQHYNRAIELDPTDMVFHLNVGAVYLEMKEYANCITACQRAAEVGQENRADYKTIAKAYARMAKAYAAQSLWEDAVTWCNKALANDRQEEYLALRKKAEKELKEQQRLAYVDPVKAAEAKERGNAFYKQGDYPAALREYADAIKRNPSDGKLYSNRAAAYSKLMEFGLALHDCEECIRLEPTFVKGHLRKAATHIALKQFSDARRCYEKVLELEPNNQEAFDGLNQVAKSQAGVGMTREERAKQAMQDPEIQQILADPVMQQILQQMSDDPKALQEHIKNPAIAHKLQRLMESGIIGFG